MTPPARRHRADDQPAPGRRRATRSAAPKSPDPTAPPVAEEALVEAPPVPQTPAERIDPAPSPEPASPEDEDRERRERIARRHELGRPELTELELGNTTHKVAEVEPLDVDGVRTIAVGSALWLVAFVALLPFLGRLRDSGNVWWLWTCIAGFGLGLIGVEYCRRRRNALRMQPERRRTEHSPLGAAGL